MSPRCDIPELEKYLDWVLAGSKKVFKVNF